jgi:hypothetical protein
MKKLAIAFISILLSAILASCLSIPSTKESQTKITTHQTIEYLLDALHFKTEEEMIQRIKNGKKSDPQHSIEAIEYYFRPKVLLYGAKLFDIRVKAYYVAFDFMIGSDEPRDDIDYDNRFIFIWYRTRIGSSSGHSSKKLSADTSLSSNNESGYETEEKPVCQQVNWDQDGYEFQINAPLWFTQDDMREIMVAERVQIK